MRRYELKVGHVGANRRKLEGFKERDQSLLRLMEIEVVQQLRDHGPFHSRLLAVELPCMKVHRESMAAPVDLFQEDPQQ